MTVLRAVEEVAEFATLARAAGELRTAEKLADGVADSRNILSDHALDLMGLPGKVEQKVVSGFNVIEWRDPSEQPPIFRTGMADTSPVEMALASYKPILLGSIADMRQLPELEGFQYLDPMHRQGIERVAGNKNLWEFLVDEDRLHEMVPHFRSLPEGADTVFEDGLVLRTYSGTDRFNVKRPDGISEIHFPTTGNRWRNVTKMFPDGRVELHEEDGVTVLKEAATHDFNVPWHTWPAENPGRPLGLLELNTKHAIVLPPGAQEYPNLRLRDILTPEDLPPLREGYIRMVHHTNSSSAVSIAQHGLHYDGYSTISSTMRMLEPADATDWRSFASQDQRYNGKVAVVMDVPQEVASLHVRGTGTVTEQPTHKVMPPGYTVGIVGMPKDAQPVINYADSWSPRRACNYAGAMCFEDENTETVVRESLFKFHPDNLSAPIRLIEVRNPARSEVISAKANKATEAW